MNREKNMRALPALLWVAFVGALIAAIATGLSEQRPEPLKVMDALWAASFIGFPTTGALIASRFPERPLGWMFCLAPLAMVTGVALSEWATWATTPAGRASWLAWSSNVLFDGGFATFVVIPFFLPNGTLPAGAWRAIARAAMIVAALSVVVSTFAPAEPGEYPLGRNPAEFESLASILRPASAVVGIGLLFSLIFGLLSVVARHRRSTGVERLQSKWVAFGAVSIAGTIAAIAMLDVVVDELPELVTTPIMILLIAALPASIGVAMLRHRLYDIDVIINRTLVYAALTTVLIGTYAAGVLLFRTLLDPVIGDNDIAIAASTLAVAALFGPARRRIQAFIDRRFYRARYDAQRTLEKFGTKLRGEVALDSLSAELLGVVADTVQPRHASVWLLDGVGR